MSENAERFADTRLDWLRAIWILIAFLTVSLFLAGLPGRMAQIAQSIDARSVISLGISPQSYSVYLVGLALLLVITHVVIAAIIFVRQPGDRMAFLVAYALVTNGAVVSLSQMQAPQGIQPVLWNFLVQCITFIALTTSVALLYLFPDGYFAPRWTRWLTWAWAIIIFFTLFFPGSIFSLADRSVWSQLLIQFIFIGLGVYAQFHRFQHVSTPLQRQQTKWAFFGLVAAAFGPLAYFILIDAFPALGNPEVPNLLYQRAGASFFAFTYVMRLLIVSLITIFLLLFPISFAIAILRYRLWDIDIFIRRTLIYSTLTVSLAIFYLLSVIILEQIVGLLTGREQSEFVIVLSTLAIAALSSPLRRRIQNSIDRSFYRRKYDAVRTLEAFSASLREEVDLDELCSQLLRVADETMQPVQAFLWLKPAMNVRLSNTNSSTISADDQP